MHIKLQTSDAHCVYYPCLIQHVRVSVFTLNSIIRSLKDADLCLCPHSYDCPDVINHELMVAIVPRIKTTSGRPIYIYIYIYITLCMTCAFHSVIASNLLEHVHKITSESISNCILQTIACPFFKFHELRQFKLHIHFCCMFGHAKNCWNSFD